MDGFIPTILALKSLYGASIVIISINFTTLYICVFTVQEYWFVYKFANRLMMEIPESIDSALWIFSAILIGAQNLLCRYLLMHLTKSPEEFDWITLHLRLYIIIAEKKTYILVSCCIIKIHLCSTLLRYDGV